MAGIPHDKFEPKPGFQTWLNKRLPILSLAYDTLMIPTPKNLNWMWIWGIVLVFCLVLQIVTGIILVMHYTPNADLAFDSVEHIMRDVNGGCAIHIKNLFTTTCINRNISTINNSDTHQKSSKNCRNFH